MKVANEAHVSTLSVLSFSMKSIKYKRNDDSMSFLYRVVISFSLF